MTCSICQGTIQGNPYVKGEKTLCPKCWEDLLRHENTDMLYNSYGEEQHRKLKRDRTAPRSVLRGFNGNRLW